MTERVPLTQEEKEMEKYGFNMRNDDIPEQVFAKCEGCGGQYLIGKFDEGYCPDCMKEL